MMFFSQIASIVRSEAGYLLLHPQKLLSGAILAFVPAMYCVLYIASVWNPETKTNALPVAVVNLDDGVQYREHTFNVGWEITTRLEDSGRFGFVMFDDEQKARALVRQGKLAFAVIIPRDFSANAVPGAEAGAGKVVIYTSQGNNFETAAIAKHFAEALGHEINESLNERRWVLVLHNAAGSQHNVESLHKMVGTLRASARELSAATGRTAADVQSVANGVRGLNDRVERMAAGGKRLGETLRAIDASWPSNADLNFLTNRVKSLENGRADLDRRMGKLQMDAMHLRERAAELRDKAMDGQCVVGGDPEALGKFANGMTQLEADITTVNATQDQQSAMAIQQRKHTVAIVGGLRTLGANERAVVTNFPRDNRFDELVKGANDVALGATNLMNTTQKTSQSVEHLTAGINLLAKAMPDKVDSLGGSAEGLANSVEPVVEIDAPVENSGSGFASNVIPGALWLGAAVAAFLIHIRVLPGHARLFSSTAKVAGKIFLPACIALLQSLVVFIAVRYVLNIHVLLPWAFALTLTISSLTFLSIVFALTKGFGEAGKGIAMFLLAVQLSSSGGVLPVELSGGMFAKISPWMPLTWAVESIKASMFGAYGGAWESPLSFVALAGLGGFALSCVVGRWRFVKSPTRRSTAPF